MFKYFLILMLAGGIMGYSSVAFAGTSPFTCTNENLECAVTIKCVCESILKTRVVACPDEDLPPGFSFDEEDTPEGSLQVDCGDDIEAQCSALDFHCNWWERRNCLVTLPVEVECEEEE